MQLMPPETDLNWEVNTKVLDNTSNGVDFQISFKGSCWELRNKLCSAPTQAIAGLPMDLNVEILPLQYLELMKQITSPTTSTIISIAKRK